jgi:hypothetical protein
MIGYTFHNLRLQPPHAAFALIRRDTNKRDVVPGGDPQVIRKTVTVWASTANVPTRIRGYAAPLALCPYRLHRRCFDGYGL